MKMTYILQNLWDIANAVLRQKFTTLIYAQAKVSN